MSERRRLLLHVGTHKTGTTSFQRSLKKNFKALQAQGVRAVLDRPYKDGAYLDRRIGQNISFGHLFIRPTLMTSYRLSEATPALGPKMRARRQAKLAKRIAAMPARDVLISTEQLCYLRTDAEKSALAEFVAATGREVSVVCVFRDMAEWRASWTDQLQKSAPGRLEQIAALPEKDRINGEWYFDPDAIRAFWRDFNLTELAYDGDADMVARVYGAFGIDFAGLETDLRLNQRAAS